MKTISTLALIFCFASSIFSQTSTIEYSVIPITNAQQQGMFKKWDCTPLQLSAKDLEVIEKYVSKAATLYERDLRNSYRNAPYSSSLISPNCTIYLQNYNQQFIPMINNKTGEKFVYVTCISNTAMLDRDWRRYVVKYTIGSFPAAENKALFACLINLNEDYVKCVDIASNPYYIEGSPY